MNLETQFYAHAALVPDTDPFIAARSEIALHAPRYVSRGTWNGVERRVRRVVRDTLTPEEQRARFQAMRDKRKAELELELTPRGRP